MTLTPPNGLKQILLVDFLEPDEVLVKDELEGPEYKILRSELWPYTLPTDALPNWHYEVNTLMPPQVAQTAPQAAYQYTFDRATLDDSYKTKCIQGEKLVYLPDTEARGPGHVYSDEGLHEFRISGCCEYHFDLWFKEKDPTATEDERFADLLEDIEDTDGGDPREP